MLPEEDEIDSDVDAELEDVEPNDEELSEEESVEEEEVTASADDDEPDYDDEDDVDEDADEDEVDDEVDSAVEDDEEDSVPERKKVASPMATKKKQSMSDAVREEITKRKLSGDSLRGVDIVNALAKKGMKVSPAQVSQLLKAEGVSQKARGPRKTKSQASGEKPRAAVSTHKPPTEPRRRKTDAKTTSESGLDVARLKAAKVFLSACGDCYDTARDTLDTHQELHDVL